jgi:hypothetical protein
MDLPLYFGNPIPPQVLEPKMYDSEAERLRVLALLSRCNRERYSGGAAAEFQALARERARRHPFATYLWLPLSRAAHLWAPVPEWELPMRSARFGLPRGRPVLAGVELALYALALLGAFVWWRADRRLFLALLAYIAARTLLFAWVVPLGGTQRYLAEAAPAFLIFAAGGLGWLARLGGQRRDNQRAS